MKKYTRLNAFLDFLTERSLQSFKTGSVLSFYRGVQRRPREVGVFPRSHYTRDRAGVGR